MEELGGDKRRVFLFSAVLQTAEWHEYGGGGRNEGAEFVTPLEESQAKKLIEDFKAFMKTH